MNKDSQVCKKKIKIILYITRKYVPKTSVYIHVKMYKYSKLCQTRLSFAINYTISLRTNTIQPLTMIISQHHTDKTNINVLTISKFGNSRQDYRMLPECANHVDQSNWIDSMIVPLVLSTLTPDIYATAFDFGIKFPHSEFLYCSTNDRTCTKSIQ